jgi:hypothetical protein
MFTNITNAQQHFVQIHYTKFQQNWTLKVENTEKKIIYAHKQNVAGTVLISRNSRLSDNLL